jgi:hypothetical protein
MPVQSTDHGWEEPDMTPGPCLRYPGTANQPGATSMGDDDRRFPEIFAELHALRLIVNEVFSMVLSLKADPANAVVTARKHITETIERAETMAIAAGSNLEFRMWYVGKVSSLITRE